MQAIARRRTATEEAGQKRRKLASAILIQSRIIRSTPVQTSRSSVRIRSTSSPWSTGEGGSEKAAPAAEEEDPSTSSSAMTASRCASIAATASKGSPGTPPAS